MKQHITIEQLHEMTDDQKEYLRKWWYPRQYDVVLDVQHDHQFSIYYQDGTIGDSYHDYMKDDCLPLLSIGQMIEFISTASKPKITEAYALPDYPDGRWSVFVFSVGTFYDEELCDALWKGVRGVLNEKI